MLVNLLLPIIENDKNICLLLEKSRRMWYNNASNNLLLMIILLLLNTSYEKENCYVSNQAQNIKEIMYKTTVAKCHAFSDLKFMIIISL